MLVVVDDEERVCRATGRLLAGGVAHDFNNLRSVILSYTQFAMGERQQGDPLKNDLLEAKKAGERAAALTRQLLAFSSKQVSQPVPLNLNQIAVGVEKMLRRILGEDTDRVQVLEPDLGLARADPGQREQVLMNLVVNARDAMLAGGRLTIATSNVETDEPYVARHVAVTPGSYVQNAITDTVHGIVKRSTASSSRAAATSGSTASRVRGARSRSICRVSSRPPRQRPSNPWRFRSGRQEPRPSSSSRTRSPCSRSRGGRSSRWATPC